MTASVPVLGLSAPSPKQGVSREELAHGGQTGSGAVSGRATAIFCQWHGIKRSTATRLTHMPPLHGTSLQRYRPELEPIDACGRWARRWIHPVWSGRGAQGGGVEALSVPTVAVAVSVEPIAPMSHPTGYSDYCTRPVTVVDRASGP